MVFGPASAQKAKKSGSAGTKRKREPKQTQLSFSQPSKPNDVQDAIVAAFNSRPATSSPPLAPASSAPIEIPEEESSDVEVTDELAKKEKGMSTPNKSKELPEPVQEVSSSDDELDELVMDKAPKSISLALRRSGTTSSEEDDDEEPRKKQMTPAKRRVESSSDTASESREPVNKRSRRDTGKRVDGEAKKEKPETKNANAKVLLRASLSPKQKKQAPPRPAGRVAKKGVILSNDDEDEEDEDAIVGPKSRRKRYIPRADDKEASSKSNASDNDVDEELKREAVSLRSTRVIKERTRGRNAPQTKKTAFQKKLEMLKRKKQGHDVDVLGKESQSGSEEDGEDDSDEGSDAGFIDYDEEEGLGADQVAMATPWEFTRESHQKLSHHFKVFIQHEVHAMLDPEFADADHLTTNDYFRGALQSLERKMGPIRDSVINSSAWKKPFMRALKTRPFIDTFANHDGYNCDACNITNRKATYRVYLSGPRYDPKTLQSYEEADDASSGSAISSASDSEHEQTKRKSQKSDWYLGRSCFARTIHSHYFYHWRYQMRCELTDILEGDNYHLGEGKGIDEVVEELDKQGETSRLWSEWKNKLAAVEEFLVTG
ncbi:hypothetical protein SAICODRAFT_29526 [Saitoella complicata NRRL Y-17804]|uniref:uncharacterized protein n=1 Tax=Saitoella complicata (strain BCRC 22490 / CBS 7301 / JCM 7358 / NBRC 10748 / NRRL Y-17804) TaxID=698492 RepID=UPI0008675222|nr:uncharacterized protein SAICODRAFT_29526 [Saitoella complicata NRRL Y-17804]ODQ54399.1 hypothetical protein SAICODRAFT_29526 [Saitoella complicata NRRL Y-17804]